ncbi:MAG: HEAT repeat domain-containing protein [Verrucomicrobia bacterium]|nr:MAG: HEAT repeat domain-containing protein [Verrucomicrobiota bacterium]
MPPPRLSNASDAPGPPARSIRPPPLPTTEPPLPNPRRDPPPMTLSPDSSAPSRRPFGRAARRVLLATAATAVLIVLGGFLILAVWQPSAEPQLQGRPLRSWIRDLATGTAPQRQAAEQAVRQTPEAFTGWLLAALRQEKPASHRLFEKVAPHLPPRLRAAWYRRLRPEFTRIDQTGAALALGIMGRATPEVLQALTDAARSGDDRLGPAAVQALNRLGPEGARRILACLPDLPDTLRIQAVGAIDPAGLDPDSVVPRLFRQADREGRTDFLVAYGRLLGGMGPDAVEPAFQALATLREVRRKKLLPMLKAALERDPRFLARWAEAWSEQEASIRALALRALAGLPTNGIRRALAFAKGVGDPDPAVRQAAIDGLSGLGLAGRRAVGPLVDLLDSPDPALRRDAALALAALGTVAAEAAPRLETLARTDPDPAVRQAAEAALRQLRPSPRAAPAS